MITKIKFNSQICTTREQSEHLLALGLKKETADCVWIEMSKDDWRVDANGWKAYHSIIEEGIAPAWSLHRLICIYNYNQNNNGKYAFDSTYSEHCYNQIIHDISIKIQKGELKDLIY